MPIWKVCLIVLSQFIAVTMLVASEASGQALSPDNVAALLKNAPELCEREQMEKTLNNHFAQNQAPTPFLESHIVNGFRCHNRDDIRQFLLLLGSHDFPTHIARYMSVAKAKVMVSEQRILRASKAGVPIVPPKLPNGCTLEIEGFKTSPSQPIRSLEGRTLHIRYLCAGGNMSHTIEITPGAAEVRLPAVDPELNGIFDIEIKRKKEKSEKEYNNASRCETGIAMAFPSKPIKISGPDNTKYPLFSRTACENELWRVHTTVGRIEGASLSKPNKNQPALFVSGGANFQALRFPLGISKQSFAVGWGFWSAHELRAPLFVEWNVALPVNTWNIGLNTQLGITPQIPTQRIWTFAISLGPPSP